MHSRFERHTRTQTHARTPVCLVASSSGVPLCLMVARMELWEGRTAVGECSRHLQVLVDQPMVRTEVNVERLDFFNNDFIYLPVKSRIGR